MKNEFPFISSFKNSTEHKASLFILLGIVCFYLINNVIWLRQNTYPSGPDELAHLCFALRFLSDIFYNRGTFSYSFIYGTGHWPPFYHLSSLLVSPILGTSHSALVTTNIIYLLILLTSIYLIGLKLFDKTTGLLAAGILSMYPAIFRHSRVFGPDFALTAMVCLSTCLLLYSDYFRNKRFSLFFGVSLGISMLTKWTFILFLIGPLGYILFKIFFSGTIENKRQRLLNFTFSLTPGILIAALWYGPAFSRVAWRAKMFFWDTTHIAHQANFNTLPLFKLSKFFDYLRILINEQTSLLLFIFFLIALFVYILRCRHKLLLGLWCVIPYFILSFSNQKEAKFLMPLLPAIALITAVGIQNIISKRVRFFLWTMIFLVALAQFFDVSYNQNRRTNTLPFQTPIGTLHLFYFPQTEPYEWSYGPPLRKDWRMEEIADCIVKNYEHSPRFPMRIGIICNDDYGIQVFQTNFLMDYFIFKKTLAYMDIGELFTYPLRCQPFFVTKFIDRMNENTFFVYISKNNSWPEFDNINRRFIKLLAQRKKRNVAGLCPQVPREKMNEDLHLSKMTIDYAKTSFKEFLNNKSKFDLIGQIALPDDYHAYVYAAGIDSIKNGPLKLFFHNGRAMIYYKDTPLNEGEGMIVSFEFEDKLYNSAHQSKWKPEKIGNNRILAQGRWFGPPLTQLWDIEITDEGDIDWKVEIAVDKEVKIKKWKSSLMLSGGYKEWVSLDESKRFRNTKNWRGVVLKDLANRCIGVKNYEGKDNIPGAIFNLSSDPIKSIPVINYNEKVRDLRFHTAREGKESIFLPGRHEFFSAKIMLLDKKEMDGYIKKAKKREQSKKEKLRASLVVNRGELELFFDHGQGRIYYQGKELTKRFGLYTSLFSKDVWHDSQNAIWKIKKVNDNKIVAHGEWLYLPISQDWEIELTDDNVINWNIKMQVDKKVDIKCQQTNIMLSPHYKDWIVVGTGRSGKFPIRFEKGEQKWRSLYQGNLKTGKVAVNGVFANKHIFPSVVFTCDIMDREYLTSIQNTNEIFKARVLQCFRPNEGRNVCFLPGEYEYFTGKIEVDALR